MSVAMIALAAVVVVIVLFLFAAVKIAREYERGVIFRLGRLLPEPKGPGLFLLIPVVDRMVKVDLRTVTLNVPPQEVITKDNVPVRVNAVAYFRIVDPNVLAGHQGGAVVPARSPELTVQRDEPVAAHDPRVAHEPVHADSGRASRNAHHAAQRETEQQGERSRDGDRHG